MQKKLILLLVSMITVITGCTTSTMTTSGVDTTNTPAENNNVTNAVTNVTNTDTTDWQTYTNEEYGFRVKYPSNWIYFHTVNEEGHATYNEFITDYVRFTDKSNEYSASSFIDITLRVSTDKPKDPVKKYLDHNGYYFIFDEGTWPSEESLHVIDQMIKTIQFDS